MMSFFYIMGIVDIIIVAISFIAFIVAAVCANDDVASGASAMMTVFLPMAFVFFGLGLILDTSSGYCSTCDNFKECCVCTEYQQPQKCCDNCSKPVETCVCNASQKSETSCCSTPEPVKPSCECSNTPMPTPVQTTCEHTESNKHAEPQTTPVKESVTETVSEPATETRNDYVDSGMSVVIDGVEYYLCRPAA